MSKIIQKQFDKFHDAIKLGHIDDNQFLRDKRDILVNELKESFKKDYPILSERPKFTWFNQGSYYMGTGVKPAKDEQDYDIDVGLDFQFSKESYEPVKIKEIVYNALDKCHPRDVEIKKPCVRVQYRKSGQVHYHVDFAIYSSSEYNNDDKSYIAKGKPHSLQENKKWEPSQPQVLKNIIDNKFTDKESEKQFKRVIRYLKRWKDLNFQVGGNNAPKGIALTALAINYFQPQVKNLFTSEEEINDLKALENFVTSISYQFYNGRIRVYLPVEPYNELFESMSDIQMENFQKELEVLKVTLETAIKFENEDKYIEACTELNRIFGSDFLIPKEDEILKRSKAPAIVSSNESA